MPSFLRFLLVCYLLVDRRAAKSTGDVTMGTSEYGDDKYSLVPDAALELHAGGGDDDDNDEGLNHERKKATAAEEVINAQYLEGASRKCSHEPPFLYVTLHDYDNILKYTRDGCLLDHKVLLGLPMKNKVELRSMAVASAGKDDGRLYVANAAYDEPQLVLFDHCKDGKRAFKDIITSKAMNHGADHAYGIALDANGNIYASFQHTDVVLRFEAKTFLPMALPPALQPQIDHRSFYKGTFHQFGRTAEHAAFEQGIRGVLMVGRRLWVANENVGGVEVIDEETGVVTDIVMVDSPIGLAYSPRHELVFVSSKKKHREGMVVAIDRHTLRETRKYTTDKMTHPTGLAVHDDVLYVAEQYLNRVFAFDIASAENVGKIIPKLPGEIEQLMLSDC